MGTQIPWFRYGRRETKRALRCARRWDVAEWRDALERAVRLREKRRRGEDPLVERTRV